MKYSQILFVCAVIVALSCCVSRTEQPVSNTFAVPDVENTDGLHKMSDYYFTGTVVWRGSNYEYNIVRLANDDLGVVTDTDGMCYVENSLSLTVSCDGQTIFEHGFSKESLSGYVDADFLEHNIIEGMAFNKTTDDGLCFAISVGLPLSDEYVQLRLTVSGDGTSSLRRDEIVDYNLADDDSLSIGV